MGPWTFGGQMCLGCVWSPLHKGSGILKLNNTWNPWTWAVSEVGKQLFFFTLFAGAWVVLSGVSGTRFPSRLQCSSGHFQTCRSSGSTQPETTLCSQCYWTSDCCRVKPESFVEWLVNHLPLYWPVATDHTRWSKARWEVGPKLKYARIAWITLGCVWGSFWMDAS